MRKKFIDWYVVVFNYCGDVNRQRAFVTSVLLLWLRCSACCFPSDWRAADCGDFTGRIHFKKGGRWKGGKKKSVHSSLVGRILRWAAHHCQDWGGKLLTSARSCTGEPFRLYVSLILIRSCCCKFGRTFSFIKKKKKKKKAWTRSNMSAESRLNVGGGDLPSVGWGLEWPVWRFPCLVLGPRYCSGRGAAAGMSDEQRAWPLDVHRVMSQQGKKHWELHGNTASQKFEHTSSCILLLKLCNFFTLQTPNAWAKYMLLCSKEKPVKGNWQTSLPVSLRTLGRKM